jgi:hypothetical protein
MDENRKKKRLKEMLPHNQDESRVDACMDSLIVQLSVDGFENEEDYMLANHLEQCLNSRFLKDKNGKWDGTDAGSNSINFFVENVCHVEQGIAAIVEELKSLQVSDRCIIALFRDESFSIVWPKGCTRELAYFE